jgi:hypothetical protein
MWAFPRDCCKKRVATSIHFCKSNPMSYCSRRLTVPQIARLSFRVPLWVLPHLSTCMCGGYVLSTGLVSIFSLFLFYGSSGTPWSTARRDSSRCRRGIITRLVELAVGLRQQSASRKIISLSTWRVICCSQLRKGTSKGVYEDTFPRYAAKDVLPSRLPWLRSSGNMY